MISLHYYVIAKLDGFKRKGTVPDVVPWPTQADRYYSRKLAVRACNYEDGEFILGPYSNKEE